MMEGGLPDKIDMEIEESDVLSDANKILNAMSSIREEILQEKKTNWKKNKETVSEKFLKFKDDEEEYLHLSYRLASILGSVEGTEEHTGTVLKAIKEVPALFSYDYLQKDFWKEKLPELDKSLDKLLIMARRENLSSMKEKHHIMQAMKYMAAKDEEVEQKKDILDYILPFSSNATKKNKAFFQEEIKRLNFKRLKYEDAVVKMDGDKKLEQMIEVASSLGFPKLQVVTKTKRYEEMRKKNSGVRLLDVSLESRLNESAYEGRRRFFRKTMPYLKWLIYPVLGNMPKYLKGKLEDYVGQDSFNSWTSTLVSSLTNLAPYTYIIYQVFDKGSKLPEPYNLIAIATGFVGGFYFVVDVIVRAMISGQRTYEGPLASGIGKILCLPIELYVKRKNRINDGRAIVIEIDLSNKERERLIDRTDYFHHLNELTCKKLSQKSENNLKWSEKNHHSFGTHFAFRLLKGNRIKNCKSLFDTKNEVFDYYNLKEFDGYVNLSTLVCKKNERYTLSYISQKKPKIEVINQILKSRKSTKVKLKSIVEKYEPDFIRITKYQDCIKVDDYEAIK